MKNDKNLKGGYTISIFGCSQKLCLTAAREYAEIEHILAVHGGETDILFREAKDLARTTCMSFREALSEVLFRDRQAKAMPSLCPEYLGELSEVMSILKSTTKALYNFVLAIYWLYLALLVDRVIVDSEILKAYRPIFWLFAFLIMPFVFSYLMQEKYKKQLTK